MWLELSVAINVIFLVLLFLRRKTEPPSDTPTTKKPVYCNFSPIGAIHSPFRRKSGCPRQPNVGRKARSIVKLDKSMDVALLQGLEEWSYAWLLWDFDKRVLPGNGAIKSLVQPPRSPKKVGVFACRTPHRPVAIGLSLVKIIKVEGKRLYVEGSDVVHNTILYDIKPYHHTADSPWEDITYLQQPSWVGSTREREFQQVDFSPEAKEVIIRACSNSKLEFWRGSEGELVVDAIEELIANQDMRSSWRRDNQKKFVMDFDNLLVALEYEEDLVKVVDVEVVKRKKIYEDK